MSDDLRASAISPFDHDNFMMRLWSRLWNYRSDSPWVWAALWAFAALLFGGFLS